MVVMEKPLNRNASLMRSQSSSKNSACMSDGKSSTNAANYATCKAGTDLASKFPLSKRTSLFRWSSVIPKNPKIGMTEAPSSFCTAVTEYQSTSTKAKHLHNKPEQFPLSANKSCKSRKLNAGTSERVRIHRLDGSPYPEPDLTHKPYKPALTHDSVTDGQDGDAQASICNTDISKRATFVSARPSATEKTREYSKKTESWHSARDSHHCAKYDSSQASHAYVPAREVKNLVTTSGNCLPGQVVGLNPQGRPCCPKCGRHQTQKPSIASHRGSFTEESSELQPGLTIVRSKTTSTKIKTHVRPLSISTEPRASSTYETGEYPVSPTSTLETPLVQTIEKANTKKSRNSAIVMLVRTISSQGKDRGPLSARQPDTKSKSESPIAIAKINSDVAKKDHVDYFKLKAVSGRKRVSKSPFGSLEQENTEDAFEMSEVSELQTTGKRNSWEYGDERLSAASTASMSAPSLGSNTEQGSTLTRFRSLREGVSKVASQIGQNSSVKRLSALSGLPEIWAGSNIIIESAGFGYLR